MSYEFGNNIPYDYDLYTSGGQEASVNCSTLIRGALSTNYVVIVDISNTIQGTYSYSINDVVQGEITKAQCPFLISDISGLSDISCSIIFTPSENRDGHGSIFYYTISRYTPIVKTPIRQISTENSIIEELFYNTYGYEPFQKMSQPLYSYFLVNEPGRIILLPDSSTTDSATYYNTIGIPILKENGQLNMTWSSALEEFGYGPKDSIIYNDSDNYYLNPLMLEFFEDGSFTSYTNENLIASYDNDVSGAVYRYNPLSRTIGMRVYDDGTLAGGGSLESGRSISIMRDVGGALSRPSRIYYAEYVDKVYRPYQYKYTFQRTNRPPVIRNGAQVYIASYNITTINAAQGVSVSEILSMPVLEYMDSNTEYDKRGIIVGLPNQDALLGNWVYRMEGETSWMSMNFIDENTNPLYWYLPEKKIINGVEKNIYLKFITATNANGSASLTAYGWDRRNNVGPIDGPVSAGLISYSATGGISIQSASIIQTMVKINYPPTYDNTIGNTYVSVIQDTTVVIPFDDVFFNSIGYLDVSGSGPGVGVVVEDVSGGGFGAWSWRYQNDVDWKSFSFANGVAFHVKKFAAGQNNVLVRFVPDKYKFGTASFRARLWDTSVDVANGTYALIPPYSQNGSYSSSAKTWNVIVANVADPPKLYDGSGPALGNEISGTFTKNFITYVKGYTPSVDGSDSIAVAQILSEFTPSGIFGARLVDVDNGFVDFDYSTLGIAIEDISASEVDVSFQLLIGNGIWRSYSGNDFYQDDLYKYLHLNYRDVFRFNIRDSSVDINNVSFRFRVWNRLNADVASLVGSINLYNTITTTGPFYSIPITASVTYDDKNAAPIINISQSSYLYSLGTQSEDTGNSLDFDIGEIIENLRTATVNGQPLITDADGAYNGQIPLFGLAFTSAPAVNGFQDAGSWKYRMDENAPAETIDFSRGFFHVASGIHGTYRNVRPKIFYSPNKHTYGPIQLTARIWDRSNEMDVSAGMYRPYTSSFNHIQPYSSKTLTLQLNITNLNDRPFVVSGRLFLTGVSFTNMNPEGQTIYDIMRTSDFIVGDPDPQDIGSHGLAIIGFSHASLGAWQYMLDGIHWIDIPVQNGKALHLDAMTTNGTADTNARLRFVPNPSLSRNILGVRVFQFYIWDKSNGVSQGAFVNIQPQIDNSYSLISYTGRILVGV